MLAFKSWNIEELVKKHIKDNYNDIGKVVEEVLEELKERDDYEVLLEKILKEGIRSIVHEVRHQTNVAMKKERGFYGGAAKVVVGKSKSVNKVFTSLYDYHMGGSKLGKLTGLELKKVAEQTEKAAKGILFNHRLATALAEIVPDNSTVDSVLSEKKLESIFEQCKEELFKN